MIVGSFMSQGVFKAFDQTGNAVKVVIKILQIIVCGHGGHHCLKVVQMKLCLISNL